jgi:glucosylceramidase
LKWEPEAQDAPTDSVSVFKIDPDTQYQTMLGMGSSLEESTVFNLSRMSVAKRSEVLKNFLDPTSGIGMNLMRITLGSSDFSVKPWYSYDDRPSGESDPNLDHFSIQKDIDHHIVSVVQEALAINPKLKIYASPWSPPPWMKDTGMMAGGRLLPAYYAVAAKYYRKAIQAYEAQGIPIYAFTLQNEPGISTTYPSCMYSADEEKAFLKIVKAEFMNAGLKTKIWILDHNFDMALDYAGAILQDPEAYADADAVAFHGYNGTPDQMGALHALFPKKEIVFSEMSLFGSAGMGTLVQILRNGSSSYNAWVTMLDSNKQPNSGPFAATPPFSIQNASHPNDYWLNADYYLLGQFTKFIRPGAKRIYSDAGSATTVTTVAFLNPDQTIVTVAVNQTSTAQKIRLLWQGQEISDEIPAGTVATYRWQKPGWLYWLF